MTMTIFQILLFCFLSSRISTVSRIMIVVSTSNREFNADEKKLKKKFWANFKFKNNKPKQLDVSGSSDINDIALENI